MPAELRLAPMKQASTVFFVPATASWMLRATSSSSIVTGGTKMGMMLS